MKRVSWIVAATLVIASGAGAALTLFGCAGKPGHEQHAEAYYCPMHPTYTSDKPGTCPICNMNLVKREASADEAAAPHAASPEPAKAQDAGSICFLHQCDKLHKEGPCPMTVVAKPGEVVTCPVCGQYIAGKDGGLRKVLYWTDPMIPGFKADAPGQSPMGMDLVPVFEEATPASGAGTEGNPQGYAAVLITPQKQQLIGVTTALVEKKRIVKSIRSSGTVAHDPDLYQAEAEFIQALKTLRQAQASGVASATEQAEQMVSSTRTRLHHMGLSPELIAEIGARQEPERALLYAQPGEPVWVYAQIYEYEVPAVRSGDAVTVEAAALPGRVFSGTVGAIDQLVDPMTRTTRIRARVQDPEGLLRPDMFVNVSLSSDLGEEIAVPEEALFDTGSRQIVFVDKGQGLFEPREVRIGDRGDGIVAVQEGLEPGERVVTSGNFLIDSESRLKAALQGMSGEAMPAGHEGH